LTTRGDLRKHREGVDADVDDECWVLVALSIVVLLGKYSFPWCYGDDVELLEDKREEIVEKLVSDARRIIW
jgi:hypothetical protein